MNILTNGTAKSSEPVTELDGKLQENTTIKETENQEQVICKDCEVEVISSRRNKSGLCKKCRDTL
jgi:hypothetical protein